jgi:hypothetical protein
MASLGRYGDYWARSLLKAPAIDSRAPQRLSSLLAAWAAQ